MGAYDRAIAAGQRALALATASGDVRPSSAGGPDDPGPGRTIRPRGLSAGIDCLRVRRGVPRRGAARHERFGRVSLPAVSSRAYLSLCHAELGDVCRGAELWRKKGCGLPRPSSSPASLMVALIPVGLLSLRQGDSTRALPALERAWALSGVRTSHVYSLWSPATLGATYAQAGRVADAVPLLTQAMEQPWPTGTA